MPKHSNVGNLMPLARKIEKLIEREFGEQTAICLAFTLGPEFKEVHWVTNVSRADGIEIFRATANKMQAQTN